MQRSVDQILGDIDSFRPANGFWRGLDGLLAELWAVGVPDRAIPCLFRVFERFPDDDGAGVLWSIVHGVESLAQPYEAPLRASLERCSSHMGKVMLQRLEKSRLG
jgi:hypothetical protein